MKKWYALCFFFLFGIFFLNAQDSTAGTESTNPPSGAATPPSTTPAATDATSTSTTSTSATSADTDTAAANTDTTSTDTDAAAGTTGTDVAAADSSAPQPVPPITVGPNPIPIAVFPLVSTGVPAASAADAVGPIISDAVSTSTSGKFDVTSITTPPDDPGVPPDPGTAQNLPYSFTSQLFYDSAGQQTQAQVWLYDDTNQSMIITDQMVYSSTDDAKEFGSSLIDYILSLIPTYTVTITVKGSGKANYTDPSDSSLHSATKDQPLAIVQKGRGSVKITEEADEGATFLGWEITFNKNTTKSSETSLSMDLNDTAFPGAESANDPYGTQINIDILANFSDNSEPKKVYWRVGLEWSPIISFASDTAFFGKFFPVSAGLLGDFEPFNGPWGAVSFGVGLGYSWLYSDEIFTTQAHQITLDLMAYYHVPELFNFLTFKAGLGAGVGFEIARSTQDQSDSIPFSWEPYLSAYLGADFKILDSLFIALGTNAGFYFGNQYFYLRPKLGFTYRF